MGILARIKNVFEPEMGYDPALAKQVDKSLLENCKPHHRRAVELAMQDLYGKRMEALITLPPSLEAHVRQNVLKDERDYPLLVTFIQCTMWLIFSSSVQLFVLPQGGWGYLWALVHIPVTWTLCAERFILAMHYSAHRPLFPEKGSSKWLAWTLNNLPQMVLSNFWGMPTGAYYLHHIVMHHNANNCFPYDISSTAPYDRSRVSHWLHYMINFLLHTMLYLPFYAAKKRRFGLAALSLWTSSAYFVAYFVLHHHAPLFFNISLGSSFLIGPFALMLGNFSQHIFIDPKNPDSNYGLATNHLRVPFNMVTFNDGYHITHHVNSHCHWASMPHHFITHIDQYEAGGAICFEGINFLEVSFAVWTGRLEYLAKRIVQLRPDPLSEAQLVEMMRERLKPVASDGMGSKQRGVFLMNELMWGGLWLAGFPGAAAPLMMIPVFHAMSSIIMA